MSIFCFKISQYVALCSNYILPKNYITYVQDLIHCTHFQLRSSEDICKYAFFSQPNLALDYWENLQHVQVINKATFVL